MGSSGSYKQKFILYQTFIKKYYLFVECGFFCMNFKFKISAFFFINSHISPIATVTEDAISEKLQEQELRQAELNHYVKMVISSVKIINKSQCFQPVFLIELCSFC